MRVRLADDTILAFGQLAELRGDQVQEFLSRLLEWLRGQSDVQKSLIGAGVLVVLIADIRVVQIIALLAFIVAALAFLVQLARRRPARGWMIIVLGSLAATVLFGAIEEVILGP
jgi:hypothetical protein